MNNPDNPYKPPQSDLLSKKGRRYGAYTLIAETEDQKVYELSTFASLFFFGLITSAIMTFSYETQWGAPLIGVLCVIYIVFVWWPGRMVRSELSKAIDVNVITKHGSQFSLSHPVTFTIKAGLMRDGTITISPVLPVVYKPNMLPDDFVCGIEFFNDDVTPMEFVCEVFEKYLGLDKKSATLLMLLIHDGDGVVVPRPSRQEAEELVQKISTYIEENGHNFVCRAIYFQHSDSAGGTAADSSIQ